MCVCEDWSILGFQMFQCRKMFSKHILAQTLIVDSVQTGPDNRIFLCWQFFKTQKRCPPAEWIAVCSQTIWETYSILWPFQICSQNVIGVSQAVLHTMLHLLLAHQLLVHLYPAQRENASDFSFSDACSVLVLIFALTYTFLPLPWYWRDSSH